MVGRFQAVLMLLTGDILDPIVNASTDFINSAGLAGVFVLMTLESACIPVPSEAIMLFAGFSVSQGHLTLLGIVAAGVAGNVLGSLIAYTVGYYGRLELLERNRLIHVSPTQLARVDAWYRRNGSATVFFTRMLPIVRTFSSLPAGVARMPLGRFTVLTLLGSIPWVLALGIVGREVGNNWEDWRRHLHYVDYAIVVLALAALAYYLVRRRRGSWEPTPPA
jgi:membrane protein DedA with SNARE-associated domain